MRLCPSITHMHRKRFTLVFARAISNSYDTHSCIRSFDIRSVTCLDDYYPWNEFLLQERDKGQIAMMHCMPRRKWKELMSNDFVSRQIMSLEIIKCQKFFIFELERQSIKSDC